MNGQQGESIDVSWWRFHQDHPDVYAEIAKLCRQWRARGREAWSINGVFELVRWNRRVNGIPDASEDWKLNNNYRSRYARLVMRREPDLDGIFEIRELKTGTADTTISPKPREPLGDDE